MCSRCLWLPAISPRHRAPRHRLLHFPRARQTTLRAGATAAGDTARIPFLSLSHATLDDRGAQRAACAQRVGVSFAVLSA